MMRLERLRELTNPVTLSGIETDAFGLQRIVLTSWLSRDWRKNVAFIFRVKDAPWRTLAAGCSRILVPIFQNTGVTIVEDNILSP
jgi:hypothetical protein